MIQSLVDRPQAHCREARHLGTNYEGSILRLSFLVSPHEDVL